MNKETKLNGITIVPGKGIGKSYFAGRVVEQTALVSITRQDVGDEIIRFNELRESTKEEYHKYRSNIDPSDSSVDSSFLNIYEHILDDPAFIGQVIETITTKLLDLETSIRLVSNDFIKRFNSTGSAYFKDRSSDMVEICEKLISQLHKDNGRVKSFLEPVVLIVSRMFTPSDILAYDKSKIQAVVSASGGKTSHAAILARSYGIPVVSGIRNIQDFICPGDQVLVDADKGIVYVRPSAAVVNRFVKQKGTSKELDRLKAKWNRPVYTRDGIHVEVLANISLPEDVEVAMENGADGVGLVRTEYLLSNKKNFPSEELQQGYYESILEKLGGKHCVIRTMDFGGDKKPEFLDIPPEFNPFMGWRAIRIFLERKDLFKAQVAAILKAGKKHNYSIMFPMVTTLKEYLEAKTFLVQAAEEVGCKMPKVGVLFEVPLAVLEMNTFMKEIDFASIGTNDLIQYLSAADRSNAKVNYLYNPIEPAFLKIIRNAINTSKDNGKPLSICGEMAGDPVLTVLLVGLGLRRFSVIPRHIPIVKELISHISYAEAAESVSHIESIESSEDISKWLKILNKRMLEPVFERLSIPIE
ncbi:MAG: phosphoenolpyruvate--protein phosphotransferase [Chitinivibrionales bacterium]|nr:phosphoenolpyruvate--protein phosphotransferase [Chitinivibrionales bacterium]